MNNELQKKWIIRIKDITGAVSTYKEDERPEWVDEDGLVYIRKNERGMIVYNKSSIVSYSEKEVVFKPKYNKVTNNTEETNNEEN